MPTETEVKSTKKEKTSRAISLPMSLVEDKKKTPTIKTVNKTVNIAEQPLQGIYWVTISFFGR